MKQRLLIFCSLFFALASVQAQITVLDFEAPETTTNLQYFESVLGGSFTSNIANPNPTGINTSDTVLEFVKPDDSQPWAGAFTDPNPSVSVNLVGATQICVDVHMDHIGNLAVKVEQSTNAGPAWIQTQANTVVNEWEQICFDVTMNSEEGPNLPAVGYNYARLVFFFDFQIDVTSDQTYYLDNVTHDGEELTDATVTFNVDMNAYEDDFTTVAVSGGFNGWSGDANPMEDGDGDGIWTTTLTLPMGGIEYKFTLDNFAQQENFTPGDPCTVTDASGMFTNRFLDVTGDAVLDTVCYNSCEACEIVEPSEGMVTFTVDMNDYSEAYTTVNVSGAFNGWSGDSNPMEDPDGDNIYTATILMPAGAQEYKFTLDNFAQQEMFAGGEPCTITDASGMFTNRLIEVDGDAVLDTVCYNSCDACGVGASEGMVTFTVDMNDYPNAYTTVNVSGAFNGWSGDANPMEDPDGDNVYTATILMPGGAQQYKFTLDNFAQQEQFNGGESCTISEFGFTNRLIEVDGDAVLDTVCYNSCDVCGVGPEAGMITFSVDMSEYTESFTTVYVSGAFNGWSGDANPMEDADGDMVWEATILMPGGAQEYKFTLDNFAVQENFTPGDPCTITDASGAFTNRLVEVDGDAVLDTFCYESCNACGVVEPSEGMITFSVDMSEYADPFTTVYVSGTFNGWSGDSNPMEDADGDMVWEATILMPAGAQEFKFTLDNFAQQEQFTPGESCTITDASGMFTNRLIEVDGDAVLDTYCYESCDACGVVQPADGMITFSVDMSEYADPFTTVYVSGTFNGWSGDSNPMEDPDGDMVWETTILMPGGAQEFKFTLDNFAQQEEFEGGEDCTITDASGMFTNRLIQVDGDSTLQTVCYAACVSCEALSNNNLEVDHNLFKLQPTLVKNTTMLQLNNNSGEAINVRIFNPQGQLLYTARFAALTQTIELPTANYVSGMYLVHVQVGNTIGTQKFIKQ
jgi:1,4-alpha-glucan branching enzyme